MDEARIILWVAGGMGTALTLIATWAWSHTHKRIDDAWKEIDEKADNEELIRARDSLVSIFEQFRIHDKDDRDRHVELVGNLSRVEGKLELVLAELRRKP